MSEHRDNYSRLYRTMQAGEEMVVTDESGLIVVRFRFLICKGRKAQIETTALRIYGLNHSPNPHEN
jgi:hypothetical protein